MSVRIPAALFAAVLFTTRALAQLDTGVILGTVTDASGAVVPSAAVTVENQATGTVARFQSDATGSFVATALPVGVYRISASATGFKTRVLENLRLQVSDRMRIDIALETGQITERVTVDAQAPIVDTASTT